MSNLKFTAGKDGISLGENGDDEDYLILKDGKPWKRLKYVTDDIVGTWRWGNYVETIFQDELAPDEFWARTDMKASGDGDDPDIDDDYYRVEKVVISKTIWKEMKA